LQIAGAGFACGPVGAHSGGGLGAAALGGCSVLSALGRAGLAFGALSDALDGKALQGLPGVAQSFYPPGLSPRGDGHGRESKEARAMDECTGAWNRTASALEALTGRLRQPGEAEWPRPVRVCGGTAVNHFYIGEGSEEPEAEAEATRSASPSRRGAPASALRSKRCSLPARPSEDPGSPGAAHPPSYHLFAGGCTAMDWPLSRAEMKSRLLVVDWRLSALRYSGREAGLA